MARLRKMVTDPDKCRWLWQWPLAELAKLNLADVEFRCGPARGIGDSETRVVVFAVYQGVVILRNAHTSIFYGFPDRRGYWHFRVAGQKYEVQAEYENKDSGKDLGRWNAMIQCENAVAAELKKDIQEKIAEAQRRTSRAYIVQQAAEEVKSAEESVKAAQKALEEAKKKFEVLSAPATAPQA